MPLLADGGRWSSHGTPGGSFTSIPADERSRRGLRMVELTAAQLPPERRTALHRRGARRLRPRGDRPVVGQTLPLEKAADAHAAIEARTVFGATLLLP